MLMKPIHRFVIHISWPVIIGLALGLLLGPYGCPVLHLDSSEVATGTSTTSTTTAKTSSASSTAK